MSYTSEGRLRVLVADDHPVFRFGMRALLSAHVDCEIVGEASTGEEAVALASELGPDVVLMDLNMPGVNGIEATRRIVATAPEVGILIVTMLEDDGSLFAAMRAGARGYLLKGADGPETLRAIRAVASGEAIFSPGVARRLTGLFAARPQHERTDAAFPDLTEREREILDLIAAGYANAAIAERLVLSPKTVRNNVSSIFSKLQVAGRAEAIVRAREAGLGRSS
jgi:DNA-binding NarL/FixJ family response regulator